MGVGQAPSLLRSSQDTLDPKFAAVVKFVSEAMVAKAAKRHRKQVVNPAALYQKQKQAQSGGGMHHHNLLQTQNHQSNPPIQATSLKPPLETMPQPLAQRSPTHPTHSDVVFTPFRFGELDLLLSHMPLSI